MANEKLDKCMEMADLTGILGTRAPVSSDVGLILEIATTLLFTIGYFVERRKGRHCVLMGAAVVVNVLFVISYMVGRLVREEVPTPPTQFATLYRAVVVPHGVLSVLVLAMAIFQAFLAYRWRKKANGTIVLGNRRPTHRKLGFVTLVLWYFSFFTGIIIYAILYVL